MNLNIGIAAECVPCNIKMETSSLSPAVISSEDSRHLWAIAYKAQNNEYLMNTPNISSSASTIIKKNEFTNNPSSKNSFKETSYGVHSAQLDNNTYNTLTPLEKQPVSGTLDLSMFRAPKKLDKSTSYYDSPMPYLDIPTFTINRKQMLISASTGDHGGEKSSTEYPLICTQCDQTFSRQYNLKSHYLIHIQERPYQCEICGRHFRQHHNLKRHGKLHTEEPPYQCKICERSFILLDALNRHLKMDHAGMSGCSGINIETHARDISDDKKEETGAPRVPNRKSVSRYTSLLSLRCSVPEQIKSQILDTEINLSKSSDQSEYCSSSSASFFHRNKDHSQSESNATLSTYQVNLWNTCDIAMATHIVQETQSSTSLFESKTKVGSNIKSMDQMMHPSSSRSHLSAACSGDTSYSDYSKISKSSTESGSFDVFCVDSSMSYHSIGEDTLLPTGECKAARKSPLLFKCQLERKNQYLEARVKELETDLINIRLLKQESEWFEDRVQELEVESTLLKNLLQEH